MGKGWFWVGIGGKRKLKVKSFYLKCKHYHEKTFNLLQKD